MEVLAALSMEYGYWLAVVSVSLDGLEHDQISYIGDAFQGVEPAWLTDFDVASQNLVWAKWWARGRDFF